MRPDLVESLQFRDLGRTAMVRLAEAGATTPEIAAINKRQFFEANLHGRAEARARGTIP